VAVVFLQGEIDAPRQCRHQNQQPVRVELAEPAIAGHHDRRAGHAQQQAAPMPGPGHLLEHPVRDQQAEQRRGLRQHTGRPGADPALAVVDGHMVQADREQAKQQQGGHVPEPGQGDAAQQRDDRHEQRRHDKARQRQVRGRIALQAQADAGGRVGPAQQHEEYGAGDFQ